MSVQCVGVTLHVLSRKQLIQATATRLVGSEGGHGCCMCCGSVFVRSFLGNSPGTGMARESYARTGLDTIRVD